MDGTKFLNLPTYKSHKVVGAAKIARIELDADHAQREGRETDGSATLHFTQPELRSIRVTHDYMRKHTPKVGGYFVVYDDGYQSWSPADAFEAGYTMVDYPCSD